MDRRKCKCARLLPGMVGRLLLAVLYQPSGPKLGEFSRSDGRLGLTLWFCDRVLSTVIYGLLQISSVSCGSSSSYQRRKHEAWKNLMRSSRPESPRASSSGINAGSSKMQSMTSLVRTKCKSPSEALEMWWSWFMVLSTLYHL